MKVTKKLLSVLLAVTMIMSSMSVCFGSIGFTAAAEDDPIVALVEALKSENVTKAGNTDNADGVKVTTSYGSGTGNIQNTVTIETSTYAAYVDLKNVLILLDKGIKATKEWAKLENTDDAKTPRKCTSTYHIEVELLESLASNGLSLTSPIKTFINYALRSTGMIKHESAESYRNSSRFGNPSATHGSVPDSYANTVIIKTSDYKGYLATRGAYTNVESTINLGYTYTLKMWELYYQYKDSGFLANTHRCIHNMLFKSKGGFDAPSAYTAADNTAAKTYVDNHAAAINAFTSVDFDGLLAKVSDGTIDTFLSDFNTAVSNATTYVGGAGTYNKLFGAFATAVADQMASIQSAKDLQNFLPIIDDWQEFVAANPNYGVFNWGGFGEKGSATHTKLVEDFAKFDQWFKTLQAGGTVLDYFANAGDINLDYYYNFYDNVYAYHLNDTKIKADEFYNTYKDTYKDYSTEEQSILYSEIKGYTDAIPNYRSNVRGKELQVINAIYTEGYMYLEDLREALYCEINPYVLYFAAEADRNFSDLKTEDVWTKIEEAKTNKSGLDALYNEVKNRIGTTAADSILNTVRTSADTMIANLYKLLGDRFTAEVNNAYNVYTELGKPKELDVPTFLQLNAVLSAIEHSIITDLDAIGQGSYINADTRAKYDEMNVSIIPVYNAYKTTYGFGQYEQTQLTYEDRKPYENDELKTGYDPVTEAELNNLITALDKIITSDLLGDLLGQEDFNIGDLLKDAVRGALFSDEMINTVIQLLYPLVTDTFEDVFEGLPSTVDVTDPISVTVDVEYEKELHDVLKITGFNAYPDLLATELDESKYADNIAKLKAAKLNWEHVAIRDPETELLTLDWGVNAAKERYENGEMSLADFETFFYNAFSDAMQGILPLLAALVSNVTWDAPNVSRIAYAEKSISIIATIQLQVDLKLGATGNPGYANLLIPIYEALGLTKDEYTDASEINGSQDIAYVFRAIIEPLFTFMDKLGEAPVDTLLGILPNLTYALAFDMVPGLLNMLRTNITYSANEVSLGVGSVLNDGYEILVGDMLDLSTLGIDLSGGINGLFSLLGIDLPAIDQATLATLGSLDKVDTQRLDYIYSGLEGTGKAYSITADKADVGYYLLTYLLNIVKNELEFTNLLGAFVTLKDENGEPILDEFGNTQPDEEALAGIKTVVYETLNLDEADVGDAIAAIVELANQVEYTVDGYYWYDGTKGTATGLTPADEIYLSYDNDWTREKAEYLYNNLESIINGIIKTVDADSTFSIEEALEAKINGLYTNANLTALAKLLAGLDINALLASSGTELPIDVNGLLRDELGIDLSVFAQYANLADDYNWGFEDGNGAAFGAKLVEILAPFRPAIDFIFAGQDLTLIDSAITLQGYNGYDNAIVPLLEALGCDNVTALGENEDALQKLVEALIARLARLTQNDYNSTIKDMLDSLPGVIYYLASDALSQGVDKLLTPVYAVLDTIRPIYDIDLAEMIKTATEGTGFNIDLKHLDIQFVVDLLYKLLGLDVDFLGTLIYDVCKHIGVEYDSASTLNSTWKKGAFHNNFDATDLLTVILSYVLDWGTEAENAAALDRLIGIDIISKLKDVFAEVEITYGTPNWMYWFTTQEEFDAYVNGNTTLPNTLLALEYPNDWSDESAQYIADNLAELVDMVIGFVNKDKADAAKNVKDLLGGLLNGYLTADSLNQLVDLIIGLLETIDENLLDAAGRLLDVNINGLKTYEAPEIVATDDQTLTEAFAAEFANVLTTYAGGLMNWLFFGDDFRFAKQSDKTDTIVINGGLGYEKGLALVLEALGCDVPAADEATVANVLGSLAARVDEILAAPVNEALDLLPNLVYFLNANGASVAVDNILQPVYALLTKLEAFGVNLDLAGLIGFDLKYLSLEDILGLVTEKTGLDLSAAEEILVDLCIGKIEKATYTYKMTADRKDTLTVLLTTALLLVEDEEFAAKLDEMLGTDIVSAIKEVFESAPVTYVTPDWDYCWSEDGIDYDNHTIDIIKKAIEYPNDWTEEKSEYLADNLPVLVNMVISMIEIEGVKYESLAALIDAKVDIYTPEVLGAIQKALGDLIGGLDGDLKNLVNVALGAADELLGADVNGLLTYDVSGVNSKETFVAALTGMLMEVEGLVDWLLLGEDYELFVDDDGDMVYEDGEAIITLNGGHGYAEGLALLLEALGCENLPTVYDKETINTEATVKAVLTSLANRIDEVLANPVVEVIDLLPNILYFLNTNGVAAVVDNLIGAINALLIKIEGFGLNVDINELINIKKLMKIEDTDATISLDNLAMVDILQAVSYMVDLDLTALEDVLIGFALGEVKAYESISRTDVTFKMEYKDEFDKHDMITVLVTAALLVVFETEGNAEKLNEMINTDILTAIKAVFEEGTVVYSVPEWDYPLNDNGTVDAMKYSIEYPNNWTETTAAYLAAELPEIGDMIAGMIDSNYTSLSALLKDKVNVFTSENLQSIVNLITDLLKDIDDGLLEAAGLLLEVDVAGLKAYKALEGITTADAFAAELANVLNTYAKGIVEWLLLGDDYRFFVKDVDENGIPVDFITINGAHGYAEGLALLLEALGCENLPEVYGVENLDTAKVVEAVLASLATRINEIFENPVEEVIDLLPNLLYFLNTNGVAAVVDNLTAALTALLTKLEVFGVEVDLNELVNLQKLMNIEGKGATISLDNLAMADVLQAVSLMTGLDLTHIEKVLVGFALGKVAEYETVSDYCAPAKKMSYADEFDKHDMVTVIANIVLITLADEANEEFVKNLIGEDIYSVIISLFDMEEIPVQEFNWQFADKADTGYTFSAIETSDLYKNHKYGPLYTEEMANYISDNIGEFIDNVIYLLGISINGKSIDSLTELLNGLVNGSLYNSANVIAIRDALAGVLEGIGDLEVNGTNVGKHIKAVLKTAGIADLDAVAKVNVPEFAEDRAQFVTYLCDVIEPLYPVLKWVLADEDISFFVDTDKSDLISLKGAEGYAYGIIPLLETLECENVLTPDEYYKAIEAGGDNVLTAILNPLLDRVDVIIENPAEEILSMLPNLIYFINSNGVDTVVKNTLNAVYALLRTIEPIAKIDLYELIGIDLSTLTFEKLFDMAIDMIADATGYQFSTLDASAVAELTVGTLVSYDSANGNKAYKMVYQSEAAEGEMVTVVMRLIVTFIMHENNREALIGLLKDNLGMTEDAENYLRGLLDMIAGCATETYLGMDKALATLYYIFYGADIAVGETAGGLKDINAKWQQILKDMGKSDDPNEKTLGNLLADFLDTYLDDVLTSEGLAPNGLIAFFQKIIAFFNKIIEWIKGLFN